MLSQITSQQALSPLPDEEQNEQLWEIVCNAIEALIALEQTGQAPAIVKESRMLLEKSLDGETSRLDGKAGLSS